MDERHFKVQGSAPEPYEVTFVRRTDKNLSAACTCQAGVMGQYCKHRFAIMAGDATGIVSPNTADVAVVKSWVAGTDVEAALIRLTEAEDQLEKAKRNVSAMKKQVAAALKD